MAFTEPLSSFFADFGEEAIWKGTESISAIFDNAFNLTGGVVEDTKPSILVQSGEVAGVEQQQTINVRNMDYRIVGIQPDTNGGTTLLLLEAQA